MSSYRPMSFFYRHHNCIVSVVMVPQYILCLCCRHHNALCVSVIASIMSFLLALTTYNAGIDFRRRICRCQSLTSEVDPRTLKIFMMAFK